MNKEFFKKLWTEISIFNRDFFNKPLGLHIAWGIVFVFVFVFGLLLTLDHITDHTTTYKVPNVVALSVSEAKKEIRKTGLTALITDSLYISTLPPNSIIKQIPDSGSEVKKGRNIFLVVNKSRPPMIEIPNIKGMSYIEATEILKLKGLYVNEYIYRDDIAKNLVIDYWHRGVPLSGGSKVPVGAGISLVIGNGNATSMEYVWVPDLTDKTYLEAISIASNLKLQLNVIGEGRNAVESDLFNLIIEKQEPYYLDENNKNKKLMQGSTIKIWLRSIE